MEAGMPEIHSNVFEKEFRLTGYPTFELEEQ